MTTLAEMQFEELRAGMKFRHPQHGEQVILDLGRGQLGPIIRFHDCSMYNGQMPTLEDEGEISVFQLLAENTFPHGAEKWELLSEIEPEEVAACGWSWFGVRCPHCGFDHRFLAPEPIIEPRQCRSCGMVFTNPPEEVFP
jgi:hypothetical protein